MLDLISFHSGGAGWWGSWGSELLSSVRDKVGMLQSSFDDVFINLPLPLGCEFLTLHEVKTVT